MREQQLLANLDSGPISPAELAFMSRQRRHFVTMLMLADLQPSVEDLPQAGRSRLDQIVHVRSFRSRTPGPSPFSGTNTTSASSSAR